MVEGVDGLVLLQSLSSRLLVLVEGLLQATHEHLELPELVQERLMCQEPNVLGIVVGLVGSAPLVDLLGILGLVWVDSLQDA